MRFVLRLFAFEIESIQSLRLDDADRLVQLWSRIEGMRVMSGLDSFGAADRLKPIRVDALVKEFARHKATSYSFADVANLATGEPNNLWSVGLRPRLVTVTGAYVAADREAETVAGELVTLARLALDERDRFRATATPFACLDLVDVRFTLTRPPRFFGRLSTNSLVDVVFLGAALQPDEEGVVRQLAEGELVPGATRQQRDDLLVVTWGDLSRARAEDILAQRYAWYADRAGFPLDSRFNAAGDKEFALWNPSPSQQLTGYSVGSQTGMKALVFDAPDEVVDDLDDLAALIAAGTTAEGYPIQGVAVVAPSREAAVQLRPLAAARGLSVAYVGDDNRLWNPFPSEYEAR